MTQKSDDAARSDSEPGRETAGQHHELSEVMARGVLDSLRDHVAVIRRGGEIIAVNQAWRQFAVENDCESAGRVAEGANYLEECRRATADGDAFAERALNGLEGVMRGESDMFSMEYPCSSPEEERWFLMKVVPLRLPEGGCVVSHSNITAWKKAESELLASEQALRESRGNYRILARKLLNAAEDARRRLARELHDDLGQRLALLSMEAAKLAGEKGNPDAVESGLSRMQDRIASLSTDIQAIARQLHPSILYDLGLGDAVAAACATFSDRAGIPVKCVVDGIPPGLSSEVSLNIYRIVQEALSNIGKHANASDAAVSLAGKNAAIHVHIKDNGVGFDKSELGDAPGLGLASIHERVDLIHGALTINAAPGRGTEIRVVVPIQGEGGRG